MTILRATFSLREAINAANGFVGLDTISFDTAGAFQANTTIELTAGQLNVASSLEIFGPGADRLSIDAQATSRVFHTYSYPFGSHVLLSGMTITGGRVSGNGGIGAGINNRTNLTLAESVVSGNYASVRGGGIYSVAGNLLVTNSTVNNNFAQYYGGGIVSNTGLSSYTTTISNSTISGNTAHAAGGGLMNLFGRLVIQNSTVTANSAPFGQGSGVASDDDVLTTSTEVVSSIISGNAHDSDVDLFGILGANTFFSGGFNLIGDGAGVVAFMNNDQRYVTDPQLSALNDHGGPTPTHALLVTSPAIDRGLNPSGLPYDQRGAPFLRGISALPWM